MDKNQVNQEMEQYSFLKELVEAYEEIAAARMKKIRDSVLQSRIFLSGLNEVLQEVKASYKNEIVGLMKRKKIKDQSKLSLIKGNGKTVCLFISANTGLYGDIIKNTFNQFNEYVHNNQSDVAIIGKRGKSLYEEQHPGAACTYFDFPDYTVDSGMLKKILEYVLQYEKLIVFYAQFKSLVSQNPTMLDVYGSEAALQSTQGQRVKYIFEPSLENIVIFFESEIFSSIFEQTLQESNLAKFAARMFTLDKAAQYINGKIHTAQVAERMMAHRLMNKRQMESLSGMALWKK